MKTLKYRYSKYSDLYKDLQEVESISKQENIQDSEFIRQVKQDFKTRIKQEKKYIAKSQSKILSQLKDINTK